MTSAFSKRIGALVLSLALCLTMLPTGALAANDDTTEVSTSSSVTVGDFTVTGGVQDKDFSYNAESKQLTVLSSTPMTISGNIDGADNDTLTVPVNVTAHITLDGLRTMYISNPVIQIDAGATMYLTIAGSSDAGNEIRLQGDIPAIHNNGTLVIEGNGLLSVRTDLPEGNSSAVIGGAKNESGGNITINGGTFQLDSHGEESITFGAGKGGSGGSVTINGGMFRYGDYLSHMVYGVQVSEGHYVSLKQVDSEAWYLVSDDAPSSLAVTGADGSYTYGDHVLMLHDGADVTISTVNQSHDKIVIDSNAAVFMTLDGVELVTDDSPIVVSAGSKLTLTINGENLVWSNSGSGAGIEVRGELVINGEGQLSAIADTSSAGIGAKYRQTEPYHITIENGNITATGGTWAAGIGGAQYYSTPQGSTVIINGGTVHANGGSHAAGIGGGYYADAGIIQITGGHVAATGIDGGAGIGGGDSGGGGNITITGGIVTATSETFFHDKVGIGGGEGSNNQGTFFTTSESPCRPRCSRHK